jgi:hypothetical protein
VRFEILTAVTTRNTSGDVRYATHFILKVNTNVPKEYLAFCLGDGNCKFLRNTGIFTVRSEIRCALTKGVPQLKEP